MHAPYVGVCGITSPVEARAVKGLWSQLPGRVLALGLLVREPHEQRGLRSLPPAAVAQFDLADPSAVVVMHVSGPLARASALLAGTQLEMRANNFCIQLNMIWPDPSGVRSIIKTWSPQRTILQVGRRALQVSPETLATRLGPYEGIITDVLLDPSGGAGSPFDFASLMPRLEALIEANFTFGLGVAGGLGGGSAAAIEALFRQIPNINLDAEGRLRSPDDRLDLSLFASYLKAVERAARDAQVAP